MPKNIAAADALMGVFGLKRVKAKRCRYCKAPFIPVKPMAVVCSWECGHSLIVKQRIDKQEKEERARRKETKVKLLNLKPLQYWLKRAEKAFNAWIRERDRDEPCISCGTADSPEWHAGHFIPATAHAMRFDPDCVHKQCAKCNVFLGGNQTNYEIRLVAKIGQERVDRLKNAVRARKWTREECQQIEREAKVALKALKESDRQKKPGAP